MTTYIDAASLDWNEVAVRGATMLKANVFEGAYDVRSAFFRMPAGCVIPAHDHTKWVQVMVLEGRMKVSQEGEPDREILAGGCYFIEAGETHIEVAVDETLLLVTQGEDRPPEARAG